MKKYIITLLVVIVMLMLVGCLPQSEDNREKITINHVKGETEVPVDITKAVVFDMGILDIMHNLGVEVELGVPVDSLPDYLSDYRNSLNAGSIKEPNEEKIYEFNPDVIIISTRQENFYEQLSDIAPTIYVEVGSDTYINDLKINIELVGKVFNKLENSKDFIEEIEILVSETTTISSNLNDKALIIMINGETISAYGSGSRFGFIHDVLNIKQADPNIEASTHGAQVQYEYIINKNPDIIFAIDRAAAIGGGQTSTVLENQILSNVNAYKNDRIIYLDAVAWYIVTGGITSTKIMVNEINTAINN